MYKNRKIVYVLYARCKWRLNASVIYIVFAISFHLCVCSFVCSFFIFSVVVPLFPSFVHFSRTVKILKLPAWIEQLHQAIHIFVWYFSYYLFGLAEKIFFFFLSSVFHFIFWLPFCVKMSCNKLWWKQKRHIFDMKRWFSNEMIN